jgi:hypothetical protein
MVHALLLLMLEAVITDLVSIISLKRSTQNLQLSTSCRPITPSDGMVRRAPAPLVASGRRTPGCVSSGDSSNSVEFLFNGTQVTRDGGRAGLKLHRTMLKHQHTPRAGVASSGTSASGAMSGALRPGFTWGHGA